MKDGYDWEGVEDLLTGQDRFIFVMTTDFWNFESGIDGCLCHWEGTEHHDGPRAAMPWCSYIRLSAVQTGQEERYANETCTETHSFTVQERPGKALTLGQLLRFASPSWKDLGPKSGLCFGKPVALDETAPQLCDIPQAATWRKLKGTVDILTGYEMLEILSMP